MKQFKILLFIVAVISFFSCGSGVSKSDEEIMYINGIQEITELLETQDNINPSFISVEFKNFKKNSQDYSANFKANFIDKNNKDADVTIYGYLYFGEDLHILKHKENLRISTIDVLVNEGNSMYHDKEGYKLSGITNY